MPILHVEIVGDSRAFPKDLAQRIADAAGLGLNSRPQGTWVKLQFLDARAYAENGGANAVHPIFVTLLKAELPAGEALRNQAMSLARAIAQTVDHPVENVHVIFEPAGKGRSTACY